MAQLRTVTIKLTSPAPGEVTITIGPSGYTFPLAHLQRMIGPKRDELAMIVAQMALFLDAAGVDPTNLAAAKTLLEAQSYKI